jgi:hypothetical protein
MRVLSLLPRRSLYIAVVSLTLVAIAFPLAQLNAKAQNVTTVSGFVTGNVQEAGFRAMIQRRAIQIISLDQSKTRATNLCNSFFKATRIGLTRL